MPKLAELSKGRQKKPAPGKRHPLNLRTTAETRWLLEDAARASGRSLTQEVEHRLQEAIQGEAALGGVHMAAVLRQLAAAAIEIEQKAGYGDDRTWRDNDEVFEEVRSSWRRLIDSLELPSVRQARLLKLVGVRGDSFEMVCRKAPESYTLLSVLKWLRPRLNAKSQKMVDAAIEAGEGSAP